jgi:thioredoxin-like negative regulator of GroEL
VLAAGILCPPSANAAEPDKRDDLLFFTAEWCSECQQVKKQYLNQLAKKYRVRLIDVDKYPDWKRKFNVSRLPTYIVVRQGKVINRTYNVRELL